MDRNIALERMEGFSGLGKAGSYWSGRGDDCSFL